MSDITVINDSQQSELVTNGLAKNGELYLKAAGSTDAGAIVVYDSGSWRTFADESAAFTQTNTLTFDGTNDTATTSSLVALGTGAYSLSWWIKVTSSTSTNFDTNLQNSMFLDTSLTGDRMRIYYQVSTYAGITTYDSTTNIQLKKHDTAFTTIDWHNWQHFMWTHDGSNNHQLFINGSQVDTSTASGVDYKFNQLNPLNVPCLMDDVAVFDSDQSGNISAIYNGGVPGNLASYIPKHWWQMEEGTGTTVADSGNASSPVTLNLNNGAGFQSNDLPS